MEKRGKTVTQNPWRDLKEKTATNFHYSRIYLNRPSNKTSAERVSGECPFESMSRHLEDYDMYSLRFKGGHGNKCTWIRISAWSIWLVSGMDQLDTRSSPGSDSLYFHRVWHDRDGTRRLGNTLHEQEDSSPYRTSNSRFASFVHFLKIAHRSFHLHLDSYWLFPGDWRAERSTSGAWGGGGTQLQRAVNHERCARKFKKYSLPNFSREMYRVM